MNTFLGVFFFLQTWTIFILLGRVGITGFKRLVWCFISIFPFFWILALIRVAYFKWPVEKALAQLPASPAEGQDSDTSVKK